MEVTPVSKLGELDVDGVGAAVFLKKGLNVIRRIMGSNGRGDDTDVDVQQTDALVMPINSRDPRRTMFRPLKETLKG